MSAGVQESDFRPASWRVVAEGTGRTAGEETIGPATLGDSGMFLARDPVGAERQYAKSQEFGDGAARAFTPGLPAVSYRVEFAFGEDYEPGDAVLLYIASQRCYDPSLIKAAASEKSWRNDNDRGFRVSLPLTVLPPETA